MSRRRKRCLDNRNQWILCPRNRDYRGRFQPYPTPPPPKVAPWTPCKHCGTLLHKDPAAEKPYGYYFCSSFCTKQWAADILLDPKPNTPDLTHQQQLAATRWDPWDPDYPDTDFPLPYHLPGWMKK